MILVSLNATLAWQGNKIVRGGSIYIVILFDPVLVLNIRNATSLILCVEPISAAPPVLQHLPLHWLGEL